MLLSSLIECYFLAPFLWKFLGDSVSSLCCLNFTIMCMIELLLIYSTRYLISFSSSTFYNLCALERFTQNFNLFLLLVVHLPLTEPAAACAEVSGSLFQDDLRGVDNPKHLPHVLSQPRPKAYPSHSQPWDLSMVCQLLFSHSVVSNSLRSRGL